MPGNRSGYATKQALCRALKKKMAEKPLDKITIQEIVEDCGMNRQTFYYHFEDIYDQMRWMVDQEVINPLKEQADAACWQDGLLFLLKYLDENRAVYLNALKVLGYEHTKQFIYDDVRELGSKVAVSVRRGSGASKENDHMDVIVRSLTYLFTGLVIQWIQGEVERTPEEILEEMQYLLDRLL